MIADKTKDAGLTALTKAFPASSTSVKSEWISECANDLLTKSGRSIVLTGPQTPAPIQVLVNAINIALGNIGATILAVKTNELPVASISDLAAAISAGKVDSLFIFGGNPVYNAPANLDFTNLLKKVPTVSRLGYFEDETSRVSHWNIPATHFLEAWGDTRTFDGTYTSVQPMVLPLWNGVSNWKFSANFSMELLVTDKRKFARH